MKRCLAMFAVASFLSTSNGIAAPDEPHAYAFQFTVGSVGSVGCPGNDMGVGLNVGPVIIFGPAIPGGMDITDVYAFSCAGDSPQRIRDRISEAIVRRAAELGHLVKPVNVVIPTFQRGL